MEEEEGEEEEEDEDEDDEEEEEAEAEVKEEEEEDDDDDGSDAIWSRQKAKRGLGGIPSGVQLPSSPRPSRRLSRRSQDTSERPPRQYTVAVPILPQNNSPRGG